MYLEKEILPAFSKFVESISEPVSLDNAKGYAQNFLAKCVSAAKAGSRGAVYDLFESVAEYAKMKKILEEERVDSRVAMQTHNMLTIARCIVRAMEHDAFDTLKYDPITQWGADIKTAGMSPTD